MSTVEQKPSDGFCEYPPFPCSSLALRAKTFSGTPLDAERAFNAWMKDREYEIVAVTASTATAGSSEDQWIILTLTALYHDCGCEEG